MILTALTAIIPAQPRTINNLLFTHIHRPDIDRIARKISVRARLDAVRDDVVVVAAVVEEIGVLAHFVDLGLSIGVVLETSVFLKRARLPDL